MGFSYCMLAPDFIPVWSGIGSYVFSLLKHLPRDVEVHVLTTRRKIRSGSGIFEVEDEDVRRMVPPNVKVHFLSSAENTFSYHLQYQYSCLRVLPRLARDTELAFIHTNFPLMSEFLHGLIRRTRIPVLSTIHTTIEGQHGAVKRSHESISKMQQSDLANLFLLPILHLAEEMCLRNSARLISSSYYMRSELLHYFPFLNPQIPVVHYGIDTQLFSPKKNHDFDLVGSADYGRPIALFTGRLVASKGIDTLIRSIPKVLKEVPDALFLFSGGGDPAYYVQLLNESRVPKGSFRLVGYTHYLNMPELYSLADIFVMPTIYESFPLRLLESMACANAVVASDVCGVPEIVKSMDNGVLIPPSQPDILADALVMLIQDEALRSELGKKARQTILEGFSAEVMSHKTMRVYESIVEDVSPPRA